MSRAAVLLVDDDAPIRRMLERTLAAEGYDVSSAADGGSALAQVERSMPDAIVLDVAMPGLDGLAVTRRLRAKGLQVPILLLTARDALQERVAGLDAGADDYLVKPFEVEELTARIRAPLRRSVWPSSHGSTRNSTTRSTARCACVPRRSHGCPPPRPSCCCARARSRAVSGAACCSYR